MWTLVMLSMSCLASLPLESMCFMQHLPRQQLLSIYLPCLFKPGHTLYYLSMSLVESTPTAIKDKTLWIRTATIKNVEQLPSKVPVTSTCGEQNDKAGRLNPIMTVRRTLQALNAHQKNTLHTVSTANPIIEEGERLGSNVSYPFTSEGVFM